MLLSQDYQLEIEQFKRKVEQDHIIEWVEKEVIKSITPQQVNNLKNIQYFHLKIILNWFWVYGLYAYQKKQDFLRFSTKGSLLSSCFFFSVLGIPVW